jgi:small-conductance mechanosensitive channel
MPFKDQDATPFDTHFINEDEMEEASERIRQILDAKYEAANINDVCTQQEQLNPVEKNKLKQLLLKYEEPFDSVLGKWKASPVELQLNKGATPHHARAFPVPRVHL